MSSLTIQPVLFFSFWAYTTLASVQILRCAGVLNYIESCEFSHSYWRLSFCMNHLILMSLECFHIELSVVDYLSWSAYSSAVKFRTVSDDPMHAVTMSSRSVSGSLVVYLTVHGHMVNPLSCAALCPRRWPQLQLYNTYTPNPHSHEVIKHYIINVW